MLSRAPCLCGAESFENAISPTSSQCNFFSSSRLCVIQKATRTLRGNGPCRTQDAACHYDRLSMLREKHEVTHLISFPTVALRGNVFA
jgi:hypothetical protein